VSDVKKEDWMGAVQARSNQTHSRLVNEFLCTQCFQHSILVSKTSNCIFEGSRGFFACEV